jgi:hypothetical protein
MGSATVGGLAGAAALVWCRDEEEVPDFSDVLGSACFGYLFGAITTPLVVYGAAYTYPLLWAGVCYYSAFQAASAHPKPDISDRGVLKDRGNHA